MKIAFRLIVFVFAVAALPVRADYQQRFSFGAGIISTQKPNQTSLELSGEYERRLDSIIGVGIGGNYIFSNPGVTQIAVPELFIHPLAGEWFVSAAPLLEFQSGKTFGGARLGTRVPIPLGGITLVPLFAIDFIRGERDLIFGLGIEI